MASGSGGDATLEKLECSESLSIDGDRRVVQIRLGNAFVTKGFRQTLRQSGRRRPLHLQADAGKSFTS